MIITEKIKAELSALKDLKYKEFNSKLLPTVDPDTIIGVRTPLLKKLAKGLKNDSDIELFFSSLPHQYYEENNLHVFLINEIKDFDDCINRLNKFFPFVDNWATCDSLKPKCFIKNTDRLLSEIRKWLKSEHTYTVRFAIEMLMTHFLDNKFETEFADIVSSIKSGEYYVNMMIAWYFATALAKQWNNIIPYIENRKLGQWVHNKTIQKAIESYRITNKQKAYLRQLR